MSSINSVFCSRVVLPFLRLDKYQLPNKRKIKFQYEQFKCHTHVPCPIGLAIPNFAISVWITCTYSASVSHKRFSVSSKSYPIAAGSKPMIDPIFLCEFNRFAAQPATCAPRLCPTKDRSLKFIPLSTSASIKSASSSATFKARAIWNENEKTVKCTQQWITKNFNCFTRVGTLQVFP